MFKSHKKHVMKNSENVIEVENVCMDFYRRDEKVDNLKEFFVRLLKGKLEKKKERILENISFELKKGESIGLIGHNGAGKSTLLKIISDIIEPTEGVVRTHGVIAPLLNLGAGFDYEATGKENVYLNGAILGYSKRELEHKYNEIVKFSELEKHMNVPLKNYSSGMIARLGFAIAIDVEPAILLVDEILSVGDENFRQKCARKIDELRDKGVSFVIVSHNMPQIRKLCQKALWIENSHVMGYGEVNEVCDRYEAYCEEIKAKKEAKEAEKKAAEEAKKAAEQAKKEAKPEAKEIKAENASVDAAEKKTEEKAEAASVEKTDAVSEENTNEPKADVVEDENTEVGKAETEVEVQQDAKAELQESEAEEKTDASDIEENKENKDEQKTTEE